MTARLLDLTRLVSRLGGPPFTGVDRVELAWLRVLLARDGALFGLVRTRTGFALLDRAGMARVAGWAAGEALPPADWIGRLSRRGQPQRARAETAARMAAVARSWRGGIGRMLSRLPTGTVYLNLGHANLTPGVMRAVRGVPGARIVALIHDTIPLDHPECASAGTPAAFAKKLSVAATHADRLVFSTAAARDAALPHLTRAGRVPETVIAPLGHDPVAPGPGPRLCDQPYALMLGTIEPRKNHALIVDVWERLADPPGLIIAGRWGWAAPELLARLDALAARLPQVVLAPGLPDTAIAALIRDARVLLFPSLAEGYGLPPVEALALGTPVIAADLPVLREVLGHRAVYLDPRDPYPWVAAIQRMMTEPKVRPEPVTPRPWESHVDAVLRIA